jgi:hypothetical protein
MCSCVATLGNGINYDGYRYSKIFSGGSKNIVKKGLRGEGGMNLLQDGGAPIL